MINTILRFFGIPPILAYAALFALIAASIWGYGFHEYRAGKSAGAAIERTAWEAQRAKDQAALDKAKATAQAALDQLASEHQLAAQAAKDAQADADLKTAIAASPARKRVCLPRNVVRALNRIGQ